jgi:hypothetical protein
MARRHWVCAFAFVLILVTLPLAPRTQQQTSGATAAIAVHTATADGVSLQYLSAGSGPAIQPSCSCMATPRHRACGDR